VFDGEKIGKYSDSGPIKITRALVKYHHDSLRDQILLNSRELSDTPPYPKEIWERDNILLEGNFTDNAIDLDGDGLFDVIKFSFDVDSLVSGDYVSTATAVTEDDAKYVLVNQLITLQRGKNTVELVLDAHTFTQGKQDTRLSVESLMLYPWVRTKKKKSSLYVDEFEEGQVYRLEDFSDYKQVIKEYKQKNQRLQD